MLLKLSKNVFKGVKSLGQKLVLAGSYNIDSSVLDISKLGFFIEHKEDASIDPIEVCTDEKFSHHNSEEHLVLIMFSSEGCNCSQLIRRDETQEGCDQKCILTEDEMSQDSSP